MKLLHHAITTFALCLNIGLLWGQSSSSTYNSGDISTGDGAYSASCNGPLTTLVVTIPAGANVTGVDVSYDMTAQAGAWMSEQRSQIYCQETGNDEGGDISGSGTSAGTYNYSRTGLSLANGVSATGTLTFEMRAYRTWTSVGGCNTTENKVDNNTWSITVYYTVPTAMTYTSSTVTQGSTSNVPLCSGNSDIIKFEVVMNGGLSPLDLTQLQFNMLGSSCTCDVTNIDVYYTGTSSTFSTSSLFGSVSPAGGTLTVNGTQTLSAGTNYFWVAYDVNSSATTTNVLDARGVQITVDGSNYTPSTTNPAGSRTIDVCTPTPGGIGTTPLVWIQANSGTTPSTGTGTLTNWTNSGSNGAITINGSPTYTSTGGYNFNPTIHFNGDGNYLSITGINYTSLFVVAELEDLTRTRTHINTYDQVTFGPHANGNLHGNEDVTTAKVHEDVSTSYASEFTGAGVWRFDGSDISYDAAYTGVHDIITAVGSSDIYSNRLLGGQIDNAPFNGRVRDWQGDVSEYIMFSSAVSSTERHQIESYLAVKFGKTLGTNGTSKDYNSTDNTTIWDATTNSSYCYDIAGIARDDATGLDQQKSHTENLDGSSNRRDILTVANGSNFSSPSSFSADRSHLLWGHNDGVLEGQYQVPFFTSTNSEMIETLFKRQWKAQETGTVGTVTLQFDMSNVMGAASTAGNNDLANLRLLVDADGDFTSGALSISPSSYNNGTDLVEFQHDFGGANGYFFTIGSVDFESTPLPAIVEHFEVFEQDKTAKVIWTTSSEVNVDHYEIERSKDGVNWEFVESVEAIGNTSEQMDYQGTDWTPYYGKSFYRLTEYDNNGTKGFQKIGEIEIKNSIMVDTYPNPNNGVFRMDILNEHSEDIKIEIYNPIGQVIDTYQMTGEKMNQFNIDLTQYSKGIYTINVYSTSTLINNKIIVK